MTKRRANADAHPAWSTLLTGATRIFMGEVLVLVVSIVTAGMLSRGLGVHGYGAFGVVGAIIYWTEFSLPTLYTRAVLGAARGADATFAAGIEWLYLGTGVVLAALVLLLSPLLAAGLGEPAFGAHLRLFALDIPLVAWSGGLQVLLVARGDYSRRALLGAWRAFARLALLAAALAVQPTVVSVIVASIGASLTELLLGKALVGRPFLPRLARPRLDFGGTVLPLASASFSIRLFRRLDLLLLQSLGGSVAASGLYGAAQNVSLSLTAVNNSLPPTLLASLARLEPEAHEARRQLAGSGVRVLLLLLPAVGFGVGAASEVAAFVYGREFRFAGPMLAMLAVASYAEIVGAVAAAPLIACGRLRGVVLGATPLIPLAALGHFWAIPRFGASGAAAVTAVLAIACAAVTVGSAVRERVLAFPLRSALLAVLVAGIAGAAGWVLAPQGAALVLTGLLSATTGAGALVAMRAVPASELAGLRRAFGRSSRG